MKNLYKQKREQGFTIIEVMIVLAIAAVILLIVLLAVPALQRGSRNTQRNDDAGKIAAAVNSCLANNNGNPTNCATNTTATVDLTAGQLSQLGGTMPTYVNAAGGATAPATGALDGAIVTYGYKCVKNQDVLGSTTYYTPGSKRQFVVTFHAETSGADVQRCVDG